MDITSYVGVGPLYFGMSQEDVRKALGPDPKTFRRGSAVHPTDFYEELGCFVYYNADSKVEAVEFAEPATPMLGGANLLGMSFADLTAMIKQVDPDVSIESDGFTSLRFGIGGWAPCAEEEPDEPLEAIIVFVRGHYD